MGPSPHLRRVTCLATAAALLAAGLALTAQSAAQERVTARGVAASVQSFYDQTKGVRADFRQSYYYKLYDRYDRSRGSVVFSKPGRMRWEYARPNGKIITSDGERLVMYDPPSEGDTGQCIRSRIAGQQLPAAFSFLTGSGRLEESFTFRLLDAARRGYGNGYVLELRPRAESPQYDRVLFYVLRREGRPSGIVRRVLIIDPSGNRNRFDFENMQWNPEVADRAFRFTPPRGVRCVEP